MLGLDRGAADGPGTALVAHPAVGEAIVEAATWHGLEALTEHRLRERGLLGALPPAARARLADAAAVAALRAASRRRQLRELLLALAAHDVPAIVLKGAFLAEQAYAAPAHRGMSDVDLLVPCDALERAIEAAVMLGYRSAPTSFVSDRHAPPLERRGRLPVEFHHTIEPCVAPLRLPLADVWARARPTVVAGAPALGLAPEDLLLHLAAHMCRSHVLGASLVSVHDVHACVVQYGDVLDWDALMSRARIAGLRRFAFAALAIAARALGAPVPPAPLAALRGRGDDRIVARAVDLLAAPPFIVLGAKSLTDPRDSAVARVRRIGRALRPRPIVAVERAATSGAGSQAAVSTPRPDARGARARAVVRVLLRPIEAWRALRHVAAVRALRRWSAAHS